ncbi:hypothetical protein OESDEN_24611 [Oesophagostomum dentatum]|uniref:Uncharacterized protein n=1 Tax=Oesophagostomum dentatum TaxID=61180 RepID=A0A0B1RRU4_OESDE|nr:hypothetical protein OESDEN_24611 [Oesophagostomum dentatum]
MLFRITRNVNEKCQAAENIRALKMLTPLLVFHFICYPTYFVVSIIIQFLKPIVGGLIFRVMFSAVYFISYYCILSPIFLWYIVRKKNKKEQTVFTTRTESQREDEVYFQNYRNMW